MAKLLSIMDKAGRYELLRCAGCHRLLISLRPGMNDEVALRLGWHRPGEHRKVRGFWSGRHGWCRSVGQDTRDAAFRVLSGERGLGTWRCPRCSKQSVPAS
jgi:hypothetical protein